LFAAFATLIHDSCVAIDPASFALVVHFADLV
jgi:hypothetical protein